MEKSMALTPISAQVWRDFETDGVPSSGKHKVKKREVRSWGAWVEGIITAFTSNGGLIYSTKAAMDADLAHAANSMAWVIGDPVVANNGVHGKVGASGSGSWTRRADLPFSFIIASDAGAGTANAIQATTSIPVSSSALIWMNVFEANTASPVTVSFNGGPALTIKTNSGNDIAAGGLVAGMIVLGIVSGSTFRLVSDQSSTAIAAAAEAAQVAAEAAAAQAAAAAASVVNLISLGCDDTGSADCSAILNAAELTYKHIVIPAGKFLVDTGRIWRSGVTYHWEGGQLVNGVGMTQTFLANLEAPPTAHVFGGELTDGAYTRIGDEPYQFRWRGGPQIKHATGQWFGSKNDIIELADGAISAAATTFTSSSANFTSADIGKLICVHGAGASGNNHATTIASINSPTSIELASAAVNTVGGAEFFYGTDDEISLQCAQYFNGTIFMVDGFTYLTGRQIQQRKSRQLMFGIGGRARLKGSGASTMGAVVGSRGIPPGTASGEPQEYVEDAIVEGIIIDGSRGVNTNCYGASFHRRSGTRRCVMVDAGRKAITHQYWCVDPVAEDDTILSAVKEVGNSTGAISIEGQTAGLNYTNDGGFNGVSDMLGADCVGGHIRVSTIVESGYNYIVLQRCAGVSVDVGRCGDTIGSGGHIVVGQYASSNEIKVKKAGNTERRFIFCDSNSKDNEIHIDAGDNTGTGADGYSVRDLGSRNRIHANFDHSNTSTTNGRAVELAGADGAIELDARSCDSTTVVGGTGTGYRLLPTMRVRATAARAVLSGTAWKIGGDYETTGTTGIQINGANSVVLPGTRIGGNGSQRVLVTSGVSNAIVDGIFLTGASASIDWANTADLW